MRTQFDVFERCAALLELRVAITTTLALYITIHIRPVTLSTLGRHCVAAADNTCYPFSVHAMICSLLFLAPSIQDAFAESAAQVNTLLHLRLSLKI